MVTTASGKRFIGGNKEDFCFFKEIFTDREMMHKTNILDSKLPAHDGKYLSALFREWTGLNFAFPVALSVIVIKSGTNVGLCIMKKDEKTQRGIRIGVYLKKNFRGRFLANRIEAEMARRVFSCTDFNVIIAKIRLDNRSSQAVAIRSGFEFKGFTVSDGTPIAIYHLSRARHNAVGGVTYKDLGCTISQYIDNLREGACS